jgi:hypothetical protein
MSIGSFLKKVGLDALKAAQIGTEIIPLLQPFSMLIPRIGGQVASAEGQIIGKLDSFQQLFNDIQETERITAVVTNGASGSGPAKASAVAVRLPAILQDIELLGGKTLGKKWNDLSDEKKKAFNAKCGELVGDAADLLNILES